MLGRRPPPHVGADFRDELQRGEGADAINLREIHAAGEVEQRGTRIEGKVIVLGRDSTALPGRRERGRDGRPIAGEGVELLRNRAIARGQLLLTEIEDRELLLDDKEVIIAIVAGQGGDDLGRCRAAAAVPMLRELLGIALARHDVANDAQPRHTGDIADD